MIGGKSKYIVNFYTIWRYSPSSLDVELSLNDQPWFPPQHLFWSDIVIIFNGPEIRMAQGASERRKANIVGGWDAAERWWPHAGGCGLLLPLRSRRVTGGGIWGRLTGFGSGCVGAAWALGLTHVHRRLTGEGAIDVSPVKRRIANMVDGDGWKKGWTRGREEERALLKQRKKMSEEKGFEEEQRGREGWNMRTFFQENDKRK